MNKFNLEKGFKLGFLISLFLSVGLNLLTLKLILVTSCNYCGRSVGFPFRFYEDSKYGEQFQSSIIWFALISDVFILLIFSFIIGLIFNFIWSKISSRSSPLK